ncbi:MAG: hypothetical protein JRF45_10185 [Deltaproteobacteria bacterium]|jgi:hypothetical protein|nr:hypothetical protein [Deltaproteobacteria bacterium]MBW2326833.1 hypothetical protein [Deltaproteobacteria bacterium]
MAQVSIDISVENIAGMINRMDVKELETLCLLLNDEGQELLRRKKETEAKGSKFLSRDEVFDV